MKVALLYRPNSEHARKSEDFARDFTRFNRDRKIDLVSLDTREGAATASIYDIVQYPAIIALSDSGSVLRLWQGDQFPLMNELAYYAQQ